MSITRKGTPWELLHSWWILLTLVPWANGFAFLYAALMARRAKWLVPGVIYAAITVALFTFSGQPQPEWYNWLIGAWLITWPVSVIHALVSRREYLILVEARSDAAGKANDRLRTEVTARAGLSANRIDEQLVDFKENDATVKLVSTLLNVMPFVPDFRYYYNVQGAVARIAPGADAATVDRAVQLAGGEDFSQVVKAGRALDAIDSGLGVFTGIKNVYDHIKKQNARTFEADPQQAADAAVKALTLGYIIVKLFPGGPIDKVRAFLELPAGQELALYYAAVELALPFADNLAEGGLDLLGKVIEKNRAEMEQRLASFASPADADAAKTVLGELQQRMGQMLGQVKVYAGPLAEKLQSYMPTILNAADSVSGGLATAVDMLPAYRLLCARLAAEAAAKRAVG